MNKGKKKNILLIALFVVVIILNIFLFLNIYEKSDSKNVTDLSSKTWKKSILEKEDGWYYFMVSEKVSVIDEDSNVENLIYYTRMDGCNIKYQYLENNYIPIIDKKNENNSSKILASPPNLVNSHKSKDGGKTESNELEEINNLIEESNWGNLITDEELSSIEFVNFNKDDIVQLWNSLYELKYDSDYGNYTNYNSCVIEKDDSSHFQVGIIFDYFKIAFVRIDYVYDDGTYLTDKIANSNFTSEEKEIYENIKKIEAEILKDKSFSLNNKFNDLKKDSFYIELFNILQRIENNK